MWKNMHVQEISNYPANLAPKPEYSQIPTQTDMVNLTPNAVSMIFNNQTPDGFEPWLQIIDTKKIKPASGAGGDRYRCNDEQTD